LVLDPPSDLRAALSHISNEFFALVMYITGFNTPVPLATNIDRNLATPDQSVAYVGAPAILSFIGQNDERSVGAGEEEMTQYELKRTESWEDTSTNTDRETQSARHPWKHRFWIGVMSRSLTKCVGVKS